MFLLSVVCEHLIAELQPVKRANGAPWVRKSGNLSMREILVVTQAYVRRTDSGGGGGESQDSLTREGECHLFLAGNRMTRRRFWKTGFFKSLSLFSKAIVRQYWSFKLEKKYLISVNGKKKFKRILSCFFGGRRKVQVTKFAFEDFIFVVFCCELSRHIAWVCSIWQWSWPQT